MFAKFLLIMAVFFALIIYPYWLLYYFVGLKYVFFISLLGFVVFVKVLEK